jgi:catechol 2,3-dioxygenase-like lactoylglutathione lyase family enzyme
VGHFSVVVRDPNRSARWWIKHFGMVKAFSFENGVAVECPSVTIVLRKGKPNPKAFGHMSFHLRSLRALREALADLRKGKVDLEDPGDEIGPEAPGSKNLGLWFHDPDGYRWELNVQNARRAGTS